MIALPQGYLWDPTIAMGPETAALTALVWPNYLVLESDIPEPGFKIEIERREFIRRFPVWGIRHETTRELVAFAHAVQVRADPEKETLPEAGWRFAIQSAFSKEQPNCLCLIIANVDPKTRGLGLSRILIERAKLACRELGYSTMIAPVRPTLKHEEPGLSIEEYVAKGTDPWIRTHEKCGGHVVNICHESVRIRATLPKWREWTGLPLKAGGEAIIPGGLVPLEVSLEEGVGTYIEPGVWVRYAL